MRVLRTVAEVRAALAQPRRAGAQIGLVPTMGAFHEGHLSLMRRARDDCDVVVVSLFVNPTQFGEAADLAAYPRDESRDAELASAAGVDLMFAPDSEEIYPGGLRDDRVGRRASPSASRASIAAGRISTASRPSS